MTETGIDLRQLASRVAGQAASGEQIDVMVGHGRSTSVKVFGGEVESFTSAESYAVGIRVIAGGRQGFASAGSIDPDVVAETLAEARDNVTFGEVDEFYGLAEPDGIAATEHDHWNEAILGIDAQTKIDLALRLEADVRARDPRISGVRVAAWGDSAGEVAYAASNGISVYDRGTSCSIGIQALANDNGETQTGAAGDAARSLEALDVERVIADAADRATRLLGATKPPSGKISILLEPRLAMTLLGIVADMVDGESVFKGRSPFADRVGEQIASPLLTFVDDPTDSRSIAATAYDGEGLACRRNVLIDAGNLGAFLHNSYTGRRAGTASTGSALRGSRSLPGVGAQVLVMEPGARSFDELVASVDHGLYVSGFSGLHSGVNPVSGDFSVGADGLMIRNGAIAEPVREMTLASTIQRLLLDIVEVGGDLEWLSSGDAAASLIIADVSMSGA
ncbi:MAG TPA: TldD/PmbA family protein [Microthrixaceae bacterium]|nr:TldD/PmbA family protein [Microthrixaceae bacterium]HQF93145.1 TldD/PmbA family protein [Microthrixaceae bacterium]